jgi:hypothetical protein
MTRSDIQSVIDQVEIVNLLNRFVLSIDTRNYPTMRACLTGRVDFDYSALFGTVMPTAADELIENVRQNHAGLRSVQHLTANHVVTVDQDSATCTANFIAQHFLPNDRGGNSWTLGGRYDYKLTRTSTGWKICDCIIHVAWTEGNLQIFELARECLSAKPA